uniref:Uncharacterized protein n=1 Tax=Anguilla anguilla TaxID=7936 RepID=A0A0E9QKB7_ANGAN
MRGKDTLALRRWCCPHVHWWSQLQSGLEK